MTENWARSTQLGSGDSRRESSGASSLARAATLASRTMPRPSIRYTKRCTVRTGPSRWSSRRPSTPARATPENVLVKSPPTVRHRRPDVAMSSPVAVLQRLAMSDDATLHRHAGPMPPASGEVAASSLTAVQMLRCPHCRSVTVLETLECAGCELAVGFHPPTLTMREATREGVGIDDRVWFPCSNRDWRCNWLVAEDAGAGRCLSCRLNRQRPEASDTIALEKLADASRVIRRLLVQLAELGLPVDPHYEREGGLAFDLLSSYSGQGRVTIGHANGVVTIDLVETLDDYREALRIRLREPYRTMLGHFRHEVGHYYQWILVEQTDWIDECRELFGDERASYSEALDRHYRDRAPEGWEASYISEYATMHPWEDFAESFAHYLHITDSLTTAAAGGLVLQADRLG